MPNKSRCTAICSWLLAAARWLSAWLALPMQRFRFTTGSARLPASEKAPDHVLGRTLTIRFDSNVAPGLPWRFQPEQNQIQVRIGEVATVHYKVINEAARDVSGQASYNVSPPTVGGYFNKINCFCFTEQRLKAGETREMAVVFYIDPSIANDRDQNDLSTITLSYTFYRQRESERPIAEAPERNSNRL
jgi:cytochrome c oxidase assembly protein subunit 11